MPPRDIYDTNVVYSGSFYWPYCEFLANHSDVMGFHPAQLLDESEHWNDENDWEEESNTGVAYVDYLDDDDFEVEDLDTQESDSDSDIESDSEYELEPDVNYGGRFNPIDLTADDDNVPGLDEIEEFIQYIVNNH